MRVYLIVFFVMITIGVNCNAQTEKGLKRKVAIGRFSNETQYAKSIFYDKDMTRWGNRLPTY